ncbi:hypothetical protein [Sphingomonas sp. 3-13AW]|uniref:hypothetical protein n=1 Tax=Sphingomonas sp. 3-13AW TaxID=3050450 RepID=UPI003BB5263E
MIDLDEALFDAAADATEITVLGGYYQREWLVGLFRNLPARRRRACKVRIAVGSDATVTLPQIFRDMQDVRERLHRLGYRDIEVAVVGRSPVHFHTKLFRFLRTTRPSWFVGSANPGSARHELMVRIAGRHPGLSSYIEAVFACAQSVEGVVPKPAPATTIREFLLDGFLCHRPPAQRLFTFDAYRLSPEDRRRIDARLGEGSGVQHASPKTEGFGFGLRSALALPVEDDVDGDSAETRTRFRSLGMDTLFGMWMPRVYKEEAEAAVRQREDSRCARLAAIGEALVAEGGRARAFDAFRAYVESMDQYLSDLGIEIRPVRDRDAAFARYITSRTQSLSDPAFQRRHARLMTFAPMFDVWQDPAVAPRFVASFFADLAWRSSPSVTRRPRIVKSIIEGMDEDAEWQTEDELRDAFAARLSNEPWSDEEWIS